MRSQFSRSEVEAGPTVFWSEYYRQSNTEYYKTEVKVSARRYFLSESSKEDSGFIFIQVVATSYSLLLQV